MEELSILNANLPKNSVCSSSGSFGGKRGFCCCPVTLLRQQNSAHTWKRPWDKEVHNNTVLLHTIKQLALIWWFLGWKLSRRLGSNQFFSYLSRIWPLFWPHISRFIWTCNLDPPHLFKSRHLNASIQYNFIYPCEITIICNLHI